MKKMCLVLSCLFWASTTPAADLQQFYQDALSNDAQFSAARATLEAEREKLPQSLAGLLPTVSASVNTTSNDNEFTGSERRFNSNSYNVNLTQPLFRWQNFVQYGQAQQQLVQAEANFAQARQDLILRVAQAYFDVLNALENLSTLQASKVAIAQQLEQAKKNFEVGSATITDAHEAQARYDLAVAQEIAATSELDVKRAALRVIVGKEPGALNPLKRDARLLPPQPEQIAYWVSAAEERNFAVQAQLALSEIARQEIERNRAAHYPTLDAVANVGENISGASQFGTARSDIISRNIGLQLTIPLYQGGLVNSKVREALANSNNAQSALENAKRVAALNARQFYSGVVNGLAQVRALEVALESSSSALSSNKLGYDVGVRINIDVLNAEQQVYSTQRDLSKARFETLLAQLKLKAAVGTLGEEEVQQLNRLFETQ